MRRLVVLDPCLTTRLSHNYAQAASLLDEASTLGLAVKIYCHADAHPSIRALPAEPLFRQTGYGFGSDSRAAVDFVLTDSCRRSTLADLEALGGDISADDLVLMPTVTSNLVEAFAQWYADFATATRPAAALCLMFEPARNMAYRHSDIALAGYRRALSRLQQLPDARLVLTCETAKMAELYVAALGVRPRVLETSTYSGNRGPGATRPKNAVLGFLGGGRREKGLHLLPGIIDAVSAVRRGTRFLAQCYGFEADYVRDVDRKLRGRVDVDLVEHPVGNEQFRDLLLSCSALLLPYEVSSYGVRGSALYVEGRSLGLPMVVPAQTAFAAEAVADGAAVAFSRHSVDAIAEAVVTLLDDLPGFQERAMRAARERDIAGRQYLRTLLDWLGG